MLDFSYMPTAEAFAKAKAATATALELDDTLAEAHTSLAHRSFHEFRWAMADRAFRRAIPFNPNYSVAHYYYGNFLAAMGRFEEAIEEALRALELDPVSAATEVNATYILYFAGRYDEAVDHGMRALELDSSFTRAHYYLGLVSEQQGLLDRAIDSFRQVLTLAAEGPGARAALAHTYGLVGDWRRVQALTRELEKIAETKYVSEYDFMLTKLALGDLDGAMTWLSRAYEARCGHMAFLRTDPRLEPLRSDRRFHEIVRMMAFPD